MEAASGEYGDWTASLVSASENGRSVVWEEESDQTADTDDHCQTVGKSRVWM